MADSVRTKIRKALVAGLRTITVANNYLNTLKVLERETSPERMVEFPCVDILWGHEDVTNNINTGGDYHYQVRKRSTIFLDVWLHEPDNIEQKRDDVLQDIEKWLGLNYILPDGNGAATVQQAWLLWNEPFGWAADAPNGGVTLAIAVEYRQAMTNPTAFV